ncbi:MAG: c-type cytochrome biogenesis protein CcmI [Betaproteobacteria bacterium]|nr:c-type cytochrome biogenesis protein CcmI [Betaproteobacteria bacterium]
MTVFLVVAALFVTGALLFVLPPMLRPDMPRASTSQQAENVRLYREELANLDRELAGGAITESQHLEAKREIERRLIEDVGTSGGAVPVRAAAPRWMPIAVGAAIPLIAGFVYLWVGNPQGLDPRAAVAPDAGHSVTPEQIAEMVERLAERLKQKPDDAEGWVMLARSYGAIGRFEQSAQAYARVAKLSPEDAGILADYADMLAMASGRSLQGEPYEIIKRALKADPRHIKSLALAGSAEFERKGYASAVGYWERIVPLVGADSEFGRSTLASIEEARSLGKLSAGSAANASAPAATLPVPSPASSVAAAPTPAAADAAAITGTIKLAPALAKQVAPGDAVFIFARPAEGARMPLAIVRAKAGDLPYSFRLDDTQAMSPNARLSSQASVVVSARISKSGNATPQPGDFFGSSKAIAPNASGLDIVIDQVQK